MLAERKLTPFQGLLHAIWTDERISAACVSMKNTDHVRENADAARRFEPLKQADIHQLRDVFLAIESDLVRRLRRPLLGRRRHDRRAGQPDPVPDLSPAARRPHAWRVANTRASPPEARDWAGADLEAAQAACPGKLNFAKLLPEVERHLA